MFSHEVAVEISGSAPLSERPPYDFLLTIDLLRSVGEDDGMRYVRFLSSVRMPAVVRS
jgi:hypothetical protein